MSGVLPIKLPNIFSLRHKQCRHYVQCGYHFDKSDLGNIWLQCNQIGRFFISLGDEFSYKTFPNIKWLFGLFRKKHLFKLKLQWLFLESFREIWATSYSNIKSHCSRPIDLWITFRRSMPRRSPCKRRRRRDVATGKIWRKFAPLCGDLSSLSQPKRGCNYVFIAIILDFLCREHSPLGEVSLYGWPPIWLVWIRPNT